MLEAAEKEMMHEAQQQLQAAHARRQRRTKEEEQRENWIDKQSFNLAIRPTRTSGRFRFRSMPMLGDPQGADTVKLGCSRAETLEEFRERYKIAPTVA